MEGRRLRRVKKATQAKIDTTEYCLGVPSRVECASDETDGLVGEWRLAGIRLDDLDRDDRSIKVQSAKTNDTRTVYYQPTLDFLMDQWVDGGYRDSSPHAEDSPYLFLSFYSDQMNAKRVNKIVKDAAEGAGLQEPMYEDAGGQTRWKITGHTLRHSFAVHCLKNGMDIRTLSRVMGHKELETTKKYLRITDDDAKQMVQRYGAGTEELE